MVFATARKIIYVVFSIQIRNKDEHVPSLQHEDEFYWLENCQNSECMSDFLINERKVHIQTVKALFYRQHSHENLFWKATVHSRDLNYYIKFKIQGRTPSGKPSLNLT